jgi:hypothetical protein
MELELVPLVLAGLVGLVGLGLVADGWMPDAPARVAERRRHARAERHRGGEIVVGAGLLAAAAGLAGRDSWRYATLAIVAAAVLLAAGTLLNARYLRERLVNRGAARRGRAGDRRHLEPAAPPGDDRRLADRRHGPGDTGPAAGQPPA